MPKKKTWSYRKRRKDDSDFISKSKKLSVPNTQIVTPEGIEKAVDMEGKCALKRELRGLLDELPPCKSKVSDTKKDSVNRIIHWDSMKSLICTNAVYRSCQGDLLLEEKTVGLATKVVLSCKNKK